MSAHMIQVVMIYLGLIQEQLSALAGLEALSVGLSGVTTCSLRMKPTQRTGQPRNAEKTQPIAIMRMPGSSPV